MLFNPPRVRVELRVAQAASAPLANTHPPHPTPQHHTSHKTQPPPQPHKLWMLALALAMLAAGATSLRASATHTAAAARRDAAPPERPWRARLARAIHREPASMAPPAELRGGGALLAGELLLLHAVADAAFTSRRVLWCVFGWAIVMLGASAHIAPDGAAFGARNALYGLISLVTLAAACLVREQGDRPASAGPSSGEPTAH